MRRREHQQKSPEDGEALLTVQETAVSPEDLEDISEILNDDPTAESAQSEDISDISNDDRKDAGCQTDFTMDDIERIEDVLKQTTTELRDLRTKVLNTQFSPESFEKSEDKTKFYTGLPNYFTLMQAFQLCEPYITCGPLSVLSKFEQFILVLLRLRLNLPLKDLAFRFNISQSTASKVWHKLICILHERLEFLIEWPERHVLHATMPMAFRQAFGCKVAVIIDWFEVFIERPSNLLARAQTRSNYKHHHTVKFIIGVSSQGFASYISRGWGRVSDEQITEESGFLQNLLPGDVVLADHGFNTGDSVGFYCASLQMPAFTRGKKQLSAYEVEQTRKIANVCIHVERVIGLVRRKYQILQSREHMATKQGESLSLIDKIAVICCNLSNLSESVVSLE